MSFIGSLFSNDKGSGFSGTSSTPTLTAPSSQQQLADANSTAAGGINQQQAFVNALGAQNGLANQTSAYNQLQGVADGTGPNPAQAMLANSTGANVANQAALMAGQRGIGANPALLARQAALQGAGIQQNAAGQAAALQANQSLSALGQLSGIAGTQVAQQQGGLSALNQNAQGVQQNLLNANSAINNSKVAAQSNVNNVNAALAQGNQQGQQNVLGGLTSAAGSALSLADGGEVPRLASGGVIADYGATAQGDQGSSIPTSKMGQALSQGTSKLGGGASKAIGNAFTSTPMTDAGFKAPVLGSQFATAAPSLGALTFARGGKIPKEVPGKASVKGDSLKNDKVKALLSPGEIVLPRSVTQSTDPVGNAAKFVAACLAKKGRLK